MTDDASSSLGASDAETLAPLAADPVSGTNAAHCSGVSSCGPGSSSSRLSTLSPRLPVA